MDITIIILLVYFVLMLVVAWYVSRKESLEAYFLNKKKTSLWLLTFSNVATIVGAGATVAVVSEVYNSGISYGLVNLSLSIFAVLLLGILATKIKTIGDKYNAYTIADFFEKRFGRKNKILVSLLQLFLLTVWIAIQVTAIATLASTLVGLSYGTSIFLSMGVVILYTMLGGLKIDIISDFIQFWVLFPSFLIMAIIGYLKIGSLSNLINALPPGHLDPFRFGGVSWFVGAIVLGALILIPNTSHWQRIFSARDEKVAKKSFYLAIPFIFVISLAILFFGLLASVSFTNINQDFAFYSLAQNILPAWFVGFIFASMLAVIMSSIDSLVVGGSTIIYRAIFKKEHFVEKEHLDKKEVLYARILTALFGIFGGIIAFVVQNIITLSLFVVYLALIFVPAIFAGLYSSKKTGKASFYSILIPFVLLVILFPLVGKNTFIITTLLAVLIVLFYDNIFNRKAEKSAPSSF